MLKSSILTILRCQKWSRMVKMVRYGFYGASSQKWLTAIVTLFDQNLVLLVKTGNCHFLITFWSENVRFWVWLSLKWSKLESSGWSKSGTLDSEMVHREKWGAGWKMEGVLKVDISWKFKLDLLGWKWKSFKIGPFLTIWHFLDLDFWLYSQNDHVNWQDVSKMTKIAIFWRFWLKKPQKW